MTKDVLISITGLHTGIFPTDDEWISHEEEEYEPIEVVTPASYYWKNNKHYILYEDIMEGLGEVTKNKIKISGTDSLEIMKTGFTNAHMVFEKNKKTLTYYETPLGQLLVSVNTRRMDVDVAENNIRVLVDYELDVDHEPLADCRIEMNITAQSSSSLQVCGTEGWVSSLTQ